MTSRPDESCGEEIPLEPNQAIIDPHLHLWDIPSMAGGLREAQTFLVREAADAIRNSGHRVTHSVLVECHAIYRPNGPRPITSICRIEVARMGIELSVIPRH